MVYKRGMRWTLRILMAATFIAVAGTIALVPAGAPHAGKIASTAGYLAGLAGLFQLEVAGFFDRLVGSFLIEDQFSGGPPSRVVREVIDNPDRPMRTTARNLVERDARTGFWLLVASGALQLIGTWVP